MGYGIFFCVKSDLFSLEEFVFCCVLVEGFFFGFFEMVVFILFEFNGLFLKRLFFWVWWLFCGIVYSREFENDFWVFSGSFRLVDWLLFNLL